MKTYRLLHSMLAMLLLTTIVTATSCSSGGDDGPNLPNPEYAITVTDGGNGTAIASHAKAEAGTEVTLTATADEGYEFDKWTVESGDITFTDETANPATFTMPANAVGVKAMFVAKGGGPTIYYVTVTNDGNGSGRAEPAEAVEGQEVGLIATAKEGYEFHKWVIVSDNAKLGGSEWSNPTILIMPAENVEVRAEFKEEIPVVTNVLDAITDPNFLAYAEYCMTNSQDGWNVAGTNTVYPKWDTDGDGILSLNEAAAVQFIGLRNGYPDDAQHKIKSLAGIEYFTGVKVLVCDENELAELDLSANTAVERLQCGNNPYAELEVSHLTALEYFYCGDSNITTLDVSKNTALTYLNCQNSKLETLDVSKNTALNTMYCSTNKMSTLTIGNNSALTTLYCQFNLLTTLDILNCPSLITLNCQLNQFASLNVSNNSLLSVLYCDNNLLTALDITSNTNLRFVTCHMNRMAELDASKMKLDGNDYYLTCGYQKNSAGTADQTLTLTLRDEQKHYWESYLRDAYSNGNVVLK